MVLPWSIGLIFSVYSGLTDRAIATRQRTTGGAVTAHEPANHNRYGYFFSVNGKSYVGWESPRKNEFEIGQHVLVFYDPNDPTKNALTDFGDLSLEKFGPIPLLTIGIGTVALVIFWQRRKNLAVAKPAGSVPH